MYKRLLEINTTGIRMLILLILAGVILTLTNSASAADPPSSSTIDKYLIIGTGDKDLVDDAVDIGSSNEIGANQQFISSANPSLTGTFSPDPSEPLNPAKNRWLEDTSKTPDYYLPDSPVSTVANAPLLEGIDWRGNVALTSADGHFHMSGIKVYADLGVIGAKTNPVDSISGTNYYPDLAVASSGALALGNGVTGGEESEMNTLLDELTTWRSFIAALSNEAGSDFNNTGFANRNSINGSGKVVTNVDSYDTNGDNIAAIFVGTGSDDFDVNNTDWIIEGSGTVLPIFILQGETKLGISNSSIVLGTGGIGGGDSSTRLSRIGALFVILSGTAENTMISGSGAILNGIGLWDLTTVADNVETTATGDTEIAINGGQGCAQFIAPKVTFSNVRWYRCYDPLTTAISLTQFEANGSQNSFIPITVPVLLILGVTLLILLWRSKRIRQV